MHYDLVPQILKNGFKESGKKIMAHFLKSLLGIAAIFAVLIKDVFPSSMIINDSKLCLIDCFLYGIV